MHYKYLILLNKTPTFELFFPELKIIVHIKLSKKIATPKPICNFMNTEIIQKVIGETTDIEYFYNNCTLK